MIESAAAAGQCTDQCSAHTVWAIELLSLRYASLDACLSRKVGDCCRDSSITILASALASSEIEIFHSRRTDFCSAFCFCSPCKLRLHSLANTSWRSAATNSHQSTFQILKRLYSHPDVGSELVLNKSITIKHHRILAPI